MQVYKWDQKGFEQAYNRSFYKLKGCGARSIRACACMERDITYSRDFFETNKLFELRAKNIVNFIGLPVGSKVLVVGCALGFTMVELDKLAMFPVGIDNSPYIQSVKNRPTEKINFGIYNVSINSDTFVNDLQRTIGITAFDCIITEDVLPSYDEYDLIINNCESVLKPLSLKTNIVHLVNTDHIDPPFAIKTLTQWEAIKPEHTWLNALGENQ